MKRNSSILDRTFIATTLLCLLPLLFSALVYADLPDQVAIHFDGSGVADNYASKAFAAFGIPLLLTLMNIIVQVGLKTDPKRDTSSKIFHISRWLLVPLTLFLSPLTLLIALGYPIRVEKVVPFLVSLILLVIGNYLPKCKQNYTIGIKLPWTLSSEINWKRTHRLAGWVWSGTSLFFLISLLFNWNLVLIYMIGLPLMVFIPILYSFVFYLKHPATDTE